MNRREILKGLAGLPLGLAGGQLMAAPGSTSHLLLVFLRGGYDAARR